MQDHIDKIAQRWLAARSVDRLEARWKVAVGTEQDIQTRLPVLERAYKDFVETHQLILVAEIPGTSRDARMSLNKEWVALLENGYKVAEGLLATRAIPPRQAKGLELAYRLCYKSRRMPQDILKWWKTNQKRFVLLINAAKTWPQKQEGTDDLFKIGPFTVHNTVGARGAQLEAFKKMVEVAVQKSKANPIPGFAQTLYGDIYLVGAITQAHHSAWYHIREDTVYCRIAKKKWSFDEAHALIHELGHRYWHRFADAEAKAKWESHHMNVKYQRVDVPEPELGDEIPVRIKGAPRGWRPKLMSKTNGQFWFQRPDGSMGSIMAHRLMKVIRENEGNALKFPTAYSATSEQEHFCESLALRALGSLPAEHEIPFKTVWI